MSVFEHEDKFKDIFLYWSSGSNSCQQMTINISDFDSFNLICVGSSSCQDMRVDMEFEDDVMNRLDHGRIHCVESASCDDLYVHTDSYLTQLFLYEHSDGVVMDNGAGYLSAFSNIVCVTDEWIRFDGLIETEDTVTDSIAEHYPKDDAMPCSDVTVLCDNDTVSRSCSMTHQISTSPIGHLFDDYADICTLINIQDLQQVTCSGECPSSPTPAPTAAPTGSPSAPPSAAPSAIPSMTPSTAPTVSPSNSPSAPPTAAPTASPTMIPTHSPSDSPSLSPTMSPTESPTQYPVVSNAYDMFFEMELELRALSEEEFSFIAESAVSFTQNVADFVAAGFDDDAIIHFQNVAANVTALSVLSIDDLGQMDSGQILSEITGNGGTLTISSTTECLEWACSYIIGFAEINGQQFNVSSFEHFVTGKLRSYFESKLVYANADGYESAVTVVVVDQSDEAMELYPEDLLSETKKEYVYFVLMGISGAIGMVGIFAFIYQSGCIPKLKPKVDHSRWSAWFAFALQFWDFASDISLSFELWTLPHLFGEDNRLILVSAIGSTVFLIMPYISNLRIAANIKKYVNQNEATATWYVD